MELSHWGVNTGATDISTSGYYGLSIGTGHRRSEESQRLQLQSQAEVLPSKRRYRFTSPDGVTFQKTSIFNFNLVCCRLPPSIL
jgi:hypothetical protein